MWCIGKINKEYRERMYNILDLYQEPYNPKRPVVGIDEKPKQLIGEAREKIPMKPGSPEKYDYEYKRNGNVNIFIAVDPKAGKRDVQVTDSRTKKDFALYMKHLVNEVFPEAEVIRVILDNLNTHNETSFYETFPNEEVEELLNKIEFHYTPKHASWLNVAEIEINVMDIECTGRRIGDRETLITEIKAWMERRNKNKNKIDWRFTKEDADKKLSKYYIP
jgi:hypothetical protein